MALFGLYWNGKSFFHFILTKGVVAPTTVVSVAIVLSIASFGYYPVLGQGLEGDNQHPEGFGIRGHAVIEAYHNNGTLYRTWEGDNSLAAPAVNAIVSCATGISTEPIGFGECNSWIDAILIGERTQQPGGDIVLLPNASTSATNHLIPPDCSPTSLRFCSGWLTQATFDDEITEQILINFVSAFHQPTHTPFNYLNVDDPIQVTPGDRIIVRMQFNLVQR